MLAATPQQAKSQAAPPPANLTDYYERRVDEQLLTFTTAHAKRVFLAAQIENWTNRYGRFIATEGDSAPPHPVYGQPTAFDFMNTICMLKAKLASFQRAEAA